MTRLQELCDNILYWDKISHPYEPLMNRLARAAVTMDAGIRYALREMNDSQSVYVKKIAEARAGLEVALAEVEKILSE